MIFLNSCSRGRSLVICWFLPAIAKHKAAGSRGHLAMMRGEEMGKSDSCTMIKWGKGIEVRFLLGPTTVIEPMIEEAVWNACLYTCGDLPEEIADLFDVEQGWTEDGERELFTIRWADGEFELRNDPQPKPAAPQLRSTGGRRADQRKLFAGLDCLPGQGDLFPTDGSE